MENSIYIEIIAAAVVVFLAMIVSVAIPPRYTRRILGTTAVVTVIMALGMYGYGHSYLLINGVENHTRLTSILRTVFDASRIFVGSNNWSAIRTAYDDLWKGWEVIFWTLNLLAMMTSASAVIVSLGSRLLKKVRIWIFRMRDITLIYGLNDHTLEFGRVLTEQEKTAVIYIDRTEQTKHHISVDQMGALLLEYIATAFENTGKMPSEPYAVKTIVTTELCSRICEAHGVHLYNVLTGFKFIGEVIKNHEIAGHGTFLLGFEESYGYLKGTYARDKDAVVASLLICEMAAYYKTRNMTLIDALDEIFEKYGYFRESVISISMDGLDGAERMAAMMSGLRKNPPCEIGGKKVAIFKDFLEEKTVDFRSGAAYGTGLPKSDVLYYLMEDDNLVVVRPSGTEPKVKVYILANGKDDADAQANAEACIAGARKLIEG